LKPAHLLDFLEHFRRFRDQEGNDTKKIARYSIQR